MDHMRTNSVDDFDHFSENTPEDFSENISEDISESIEESIEDNYDKSDEFDNDSGDDSEDSDGDSDSEDRSEDRPEDTADGTAEASGSGLAPGVMRLRRRRDHFWHDEDRVRALLRCPEPCDPSELAGFFDGDGCFYITAQNQIACNVTQCHYPTLRLIQECYGGSMYKRDTKHRSEKQRFQYSLTFSNMAIAAIVPIIKDHLVIKGSRARGILEALDLYGKTDEASTQRRRELVKEIPDEYAFDRINKNYIRGLFCAEGCLLRDRLSITQKNFPDLLRAIKSYVGTELGISDFGQVTATVWNVSNKDNVKLFVDWLTDKNTRRLFHEEKAAQIDAFYGYVKTRNVAYTEEMSRLKRVDFDIPAAVIEAVNASSLKFKAALRSVYLRRTVDPNASSAPPLTEDKRTQVIEMLRSTDESLLEIAKRFGCTKSQVSHLKKTEKIKRPNPKTRKKQLSPEQQRIVRDKLDDPNMSYAAIAREAKCTSGQVFTFAAQTNAPPRKPGRKFKATGTEVSTEKPPAPKTGEKRKMAPRLTPAQKSELEQLLNERPQNKMTHAQIAEKVGCSKGQVDMFKPKKSKS